MLKIFISIRKCICYLAYGKIWLGKEPNAIFCFYSPYLYYSLLYSPGESIPSQPSETIMLHYCFILILALWSQRINKWSPTPPLQFPSPPLLSGPIPPLPPPISFPTTPKWSYPTTPPSNSSPTPNFLPFTF